MEKEQRDQIFYNEDEPQYKQVYITPYYNNQELDQTFVYLMSNGESGNHRAFHGQIIEKEPNMFYTAARTLIYQSFSYLPRQINDEILDRKTIGMPLYQYNPMVSDILRTLTRNHKTIFNFEDDSLYITYPLHKRIDTQEVNDLLSPFKTKFHEYTLDDLVGEEKNKQFIDQETQLILQISLNNNFLESLINSEDYQKPKACVILDNHAKIWVDQYEAIIMGTYMSNQLSSWRFYNSEAGEFPNQEDLKHIKVCFVLGSFEGDLTYSKYDNLLPFIGDMVANHSNVKMVGLGSGSLIIAKFFESKIGYVAEEKEKIKYMGRTQLQLNESFFKQPWVQQFMELNDKNQEDFEKLVLQACYSSEISELGEKLTLLGTSTDAKSPQIFSYKNQVLGITAHPEYNCQFQQEQSSHEYYKLNHVSYEYYEDMFLQCQDNSYGIESRNLMNRIIFDFINFKE